MAITFERHNSQNQSSTERYICFQQKSAGFLQLQPAVQLQDEFQVWETITKFIELTKSNDYFNEKRLEQEYWMLEAIRTKGNFYNNTEIKTC
jgi:hypothetical protein